MNRNEMVAVVLEGVQTCPTCCGTGKHWIANLVSGYSSIPCWHCFGTGKLFHSTGLQ